MRLRNNKNADNELALFDRYVDGKEAILSKIKGKKVNIEIGMGKGDFISKLANINKDEIYIGVEISKTILALAIKKIKRYEEENNIKLSNLYLMSFDANNICEIFNKNTFKTIYLNFSDPWPKSKHAKRRLTYSSFLEKYKSVLKKEGKLKFKTDNRKLFEFSLVSLNNFGFKFENVFLDLHKTEIENIFTEYEMKFCDKGPIYMLEGKF